MEIDNIKTHDRKTKSEDGMQNFLTRPTDTDNTLKTNNIPNYI